MTAPLRLFLAGDVMTGRGIDQILSHPSSPELHEDYMATATGYVALAEEANGPIPRGVGPDYVWGELPQALAARTPDFRIANLETAITLSGTAEAKGINYRMHPANAAVLAALGLDAVALANNHVMDWGTEGLTETLGVLDAMGLACAGAGADLRAALAPKRLDGRRSGLTFMAVALADSGVPSHWAAAAGRPGIALIDPDPARAVAAVRGALAEAGRGSGPLVVSIHWGGNWGYEVPREHRRLAHALIEGAGADVVHGHSSHHPKAIEVHHGRPIFYGCGDLLNDYEGIGGQERYRTDLVLGHLVDLDPRSYRCTGIEMLPMRICGFRLGPAPPDEARRLAEIMGRECGRFGGEVTPTPRGTLALRWPV